MRWRAWGVAVVGALGTVMSVGSGADAEPEPVLSVVVHPSNRSAAGDRAALRQLFQTKVTRWASGERAVPLNLPRGNPARDAFDRAVLGLSPEESERYWIDRKIRGGTPPPALAPDPVTVLRTVAQTPGGIGYVPAGATSSEVRVIATVRDGRVVTE